MSQDDRRVRLATASLDRLPESVARPRYPRDRLEPGILHLGVGAFHRCHQAEWTDDALEARFGAWGIVGVNLRPPDLHGILGEQDGWFCRITRGGGVDHARLIGSILETLSVLPTGGDADRATLHRALRWAADPRIRVVTLTVTEKGYCHVPATGALDVSHPDILHDRAHPEAPVSVPGFVLHAMALRLRAGVALPAIVSCDNVPENGATLRRCVVSLARLSDPGLAAAIERDGCFLDTVVDRIVPATREEDVESFATATGVEDRGLVVGESFRMWVIEKPADVVLPAWDAAGALFVVDAAPYESLKMRVLNGIQSNLCQLGALSGIDFMADVMALPEFRRFAERVMHREVLPCLPDVPGIDPRGYVAESIERLANPALKHRTSQIATDGSRKIKQRLLEPIRDALAMGIPCDGLLLGVAGWMQYATGEDARGGSFAVSDPIASRAREVAQRARGDAAALVHGLLALDTVFGRDLPERGEVVEALIAFMARLLARPAREVVREFLTFHVPSAMGRP